MDKRTFDEMSRQMAMGRSRRSILKGLIGGGAALVAAKTGASLAAPAGKVEICHALGNGGFNLIEVNANALDAHLAHGDGYLGTTDHCSACGDVCAEGQECIDGTCQVPCNPNGIIRLTSICNNYDEGYHVFRVRNESCDDVDFTWSSGSQGGSGSADAGETVFFEVQGTNPPNGPLTTKLFVGGVLVQTKAANTQTCS